MPYNLVSMKPTQKIFMVVGSVAVMAAAGWTGYTLFATPNQTAGSTSQASASSTPASTSTSSSTTPTNTTTSSNSSTSSYKDGTYTATARYSVPHGEVNSVTATITVSGGKITQASATHDYGDRESGMYIDSFDSSLSSAVQGESLSSISVYRIGGASLTTEGFNSVLDTIRSQAQA